MASDSKQGKDKKASHKTVLKWGKEFNTKFNCDLEGKDVARLCCTICAKWQRRICSIKNFNCNYICIGSTSIKKSHLREEGGAHLRISVWHLLMDLKNNYLLKNCWSGPIKNVRMLISTRLYLKKKNKEKHLEVSLHYTCVPKILIIWSTAPEILSVTEWNW